MCYITVKITENLVLNCTNAILDRSREGKITGGWSLRVLCTSRDTFHFYQTIGIAVKGQPSLKESPQPPRKLSSDAADVLSSQIMPTKSATFEEKVESFLVNSSKPQPVAGEDTNTPASEDILESLASRINQLAASDSEDDPLSGMAF